MVTKQIKISSKNQITIPQIVLKELDIIPGDFLQINVDKGHAEIYVSKKRLLSALDLGKEFSDYPKKILTLNQINKAIEEGYKDLALKKR